MKYWEIIADRLSKAGWNLGWVSAVDCEGRTIWIADATSRRRKAFCRARGGKADGFSGTGDSIRQNAQRTAERVK